MQTKEIFIALDLGSDTLKAVFAFNYYGKEIVGKIVPTDFDITAIPAVAKYDEDDGKWLYAAEVNRDKNESYVTVVKIKDLLSLLSESRSASQKVRQSNKKYYFSEHMFPKFFFPVKQEEIQSFEEMCKNNRTFEATGYTPHDVCLGYFKSVAAMIKLRLNKFFKSYDFDDYTLNCSVVLPPYVGKMYADELTGLIGEAFDGASKGQALSMTKALSIYAMQRGLIKDESALIFNIGEEKTFAVKANCIKGGLSIDGADGHEPEINLGGYDIDKVIAKHFEKKLGEVYNEGLYTKQYLFLKNIKYAKVMLGINSQNGVRPDGVTLSIAIDFVLKVKLTYEDFKKCVGVTSNAGVAQDIVNYIKKELKRGSNRDVRKVFLTGGVVETYGLLDYIRKKVETAGIKVCTFENPFSENVKIGVNNFSICAHEDSLYAPCIGCALATMKNIRVDTVTALTYGLRLFNINNAGETKFSYFSEFIFKGTKLAEGENIFTIQKDIIAGDNLTPSSSAKLYVLSTPLSREDIVSGKYDVGVVDGVLHLKLGDINNPAQLSAMRERIGLDMLKEGQMTYRYDGLRVELGYRYLINDNVYSSTRKGVGVFMRAGVKIDGEGNAKVHAQNSKKENGKFKVCIRYLEGSAKHPRGSTEYVPADKIEFLINIEFAAK